MFALTLLTILIANATPTPIATSTASVPSPTPEMLKLTARFTSFFADVLAGRTPTQDLTDKMQSALSPAVLSQLQQFYGTLGTFQKLSFKDQDSIQGFRRYHYLAIFQNGSPGVMFVIDSDDKIAGFFNEP